MSKIVLETKNISYSLRNKNILENIDFKICEGEIVTIIGPNGGGKSTLAKILTGVITEFSGELFKRKKIRIGYMPQKFTINYNIPMSVKYFLELHYNYKFSKNEIEKIAKQVSIDHLLNDSLHNLSVGEMQRALLARCLINKPNLLILDEPEQGVDINGRFEIYEMLQKINNENNIAILLISHDLNFVMSATKNVICLNKHICCSGMPADISKNPSYTNLFGGERSQIISLYSHHHDHVHH